MVSRNRGTSLLETLVAVAICTTVVFGFAGAIGFATKSSKNQGQVVTEATTLAAQKLDQLIEAPWTATAMDPALYTCCTNGLTSDQSAAITASNCSTCTATGTYYYYDFLDPAGAPISGATSSTIGVFFTRRWTIEDQGSSPITSKLITVVVTGQAIGQTSASTSRPSATLASLKVQN